jgi:hypothetical protein
MAVGKSIHNHLVLLVYIDHRFDMNSQYQDSLMLKYEKIVKPFFFKLSNN